MKELRERYTGAEAERYEARRRGVQWRLEHEAVAAALDDLSPESVLDIPCGTGRFWPLYQERGIQATGMDVSEDMMDQAGARGWEDVRHGDIFRVPLLNASVDVSVCVRLLNWMTASEAKAALAELARVSRRQYGVGPYFRRDVRRPEYALRHR